MNLIDRSHISKAICIVINHIYDKEHLKETKLLKLLLLFGTCKELRDRIYNIKHFTIYDWYFTENIDYRTALRFENPFRKQPYSKCNASIQSFIKFLNKLTLLTTLDASGTTDIYEILEHTTLTNLTKLTLKETEHNSPEKNTQHKQIGYIISSFPKITTLDFSHHYYIANAVVFCLPNLLHLRTLNLSFCILEECAKNLKDIFKLLTQLNYLDISHHNVKFTASYYNNECIVDILSAITSLVSLETLVYELNNIVKISDALAFCMCLNALTKLKTLSLRQTHINIDCMHILAENLDKQITLENLNLSKLEFYSKVKPRETLSFSLREKDKITFGEKQSFFPNETFILWTRILKKMSNLTHLNLEDNDLTLNDITALITAFNNLTKLQKLNLSSNSIDVDSLPLLAQLIKHLPKLRVLNLYNNYFQQKDETEWMQFIEPRINLEYEKSS